MLWVFRAGVFRYLFTKELKFANNTNNVGALIANQNNRGKDLRNHNFKIITSLSKN